MLLLATDPLSLMDVFEQWGPPGVSVAAVIVVVVLFLRHIRERDERFANVIAKISSDFTLTISQINAQVHADRIKSSETIERNTQELTRNTEVMRQIASSLTTRGGNGGA